MGAIYKISKKGYLLHADRKAISGFGLAWKPFIRISENDYTTDIMANAIKEVIKESETAERVPDPKNWTEDSKQFLKDAGLKSLKELNALTTRHCNIYKQNNSIILTPTKHAEPPDEGFLHKSKDDAITVPFTASNEEITKAVEFALSKCE
jgi:hypothetical protein